MSPLDADAVEFAPVSIVFEELALQTVEPMEQLLQERASHSFMCERSHISL